MAPRPSVIGPRLAPMLASVAEEVPRGANWTFEPKYDGIRILAFASREGAALMSRNGNAKTAQFPEIVDALARIARLRRRPFVVDGEIVALRDDEPARFQELQGRMHASRHDGATSVAFIAFDCLLDGSSSLIHEPQHVRREHLLRLLTPPVPHVLRVSDSLAGSGEDLLERARRNGWEGVIAKERDAPYAPGRRTSAWRKLKIEHRQELVVGGFTEPRNSRTHLGALLLGYYDAAGVLRYAGHTGTGFTHAGLAAMHRRLAARERKTSPFTPAPRTNERAHWVRPDLVVEVKFNEWTAEGKLRQPVFVGLRDDKDAKDVRREPPSVARRRAGAA